MQLIASSMAVLALVSTSTSGWHGLALGVTIYKLFVFEQPRIYRRNILTDPTINFLERTKVVCQHDYGFVGCVPGKVLKIIEASYGRSDSEACAAGAANPRQLQNTHCSACVASTVREW